MVYNLLTLVDYNFKKLSVEHNKCNCLPTYSKTTDLAYKTVKWFSTFTTKYGIITKRKKIIFM